VVNSQKTSKNELESAKIQSIRLGSCTLRQGIVRQYSYRGRKSCITLEIKKKIKNTIRTNPYITLAELIEELKLPIGVSRLSQILISWKYSLKKKKTFHPTAQKSEDVIKNVRNGRKTKKLNPKKLLFIYESSIKFGMTRLYRRAKTNERVNHYVPDVRFERTSVMACIHLNGKQSTMTFKGTFNGQVFAVYVEQCLAPMLSLGDIVVMDNLFSHKAKEAIDPISAKGATVLYLPSYLPDFNPIELSWSKMKSMLRKLKARTVEEMKEVMKIVLNCFTKSNIENLFSHCGYNVN
jgi:transposase